MTSLSSPRWAAQHVAVRGILAGVFLLAGCRQGMYDQPKVKPFRQSRYYDDGSSARPVPANTVARGFLREDRALYAGQGPDGKFVAKLPVPLTKDLLLRGQERFDIYCSPCHGRTGDGFGMIVQRGFKRPSSFHVDRLRNERIGYFYDVMTNGFGQMSSYAAQVTPEDRWAIAAYLRTLQWSQNVPASRLSAEDRRALESAPAGAAIAPPTGFPGNSEDASSSDATPRGSAHQNRTRSPK